MKKLWFPVFFAAALVAAFSAETTQARDPYLDFGQFQRVTNVEDLGFVDNLALAGGVLFNAPSLRRLLPVHKYIVDIEECNGSGSRAVGTRQVEGMVLEWQISKEAASFLLQDDAWETDAAEWVPYGDFLKELAQYHKSDSKNSRPAKDGAYFELAMQALNSDNGRAAWVEGNLSDKCTAAQWAHNGKLGEWEKVSSQVLESLVRSAYSDSLAESQDAVSSSYVIFTIDPLADQDGVKKFIAECDMGRVERTEAISVCKDKLQ